MRGDEIHGLRIGKRMADGKISVWWQDATFDYHFWADPDSLEITDGRFYRHRDMEDPQLSRTTNLNARSPRWDPIMRAIIDVVKHRDLIGEWRRAKEAEAAQRDADNRLAARLRMVASHSGELLGALTACVAAMEAPGSGKHAVALRRAKDLLAMLETADA
jgi:hypothetical protein